MSSPRKTIAGIALAAAAFVGGAGTAAMLAGGAAGAQDATSSTTAPAATPAPSAAPSTGSTDPSGTPAQPAPRDPSKGGHQANGKTEEVLTGDLAAKAEAAALAAEPGATIERVETDADGATYEAHIVKADGTRVTILFDENFNVTGTEAGPAGHK